MGKKKTDPDFYPFEFRSKTKGFPNWVGVNKEGDPSFIPANQLVDGVNVRPELEGYRARGGQSKAASNAASSRLDGIYEASDIGAVVTTAAPPSPGRYVFFRGERAGFTAPVMFFYDTTGATMVVNQVGNTIASGTPPIYKQSFRQVTLGQDRKIYFCTGVDSVGGGAAFTPTLLQMVRSPFSAASVYSLTANSTPPQEFANVLEDPSSPGSFYLTTQYFDDGSAPDHRDAKVYHTTLGLDDTAVKTGLGEAFPFLASFNGTIYAVHGWPSPGSYELIRKRLSAGSWSNLTLPSHPAGMDATPLSCGQPVVYNSKLWVPGHLVQIAGGNTVPWAVSVTASDVVTYEHQVSSTAGRFFFGGFFRADIYLYYTWGATDLTSPNYLGRYDGSTWNDTYYQIDTTYGGIALLYVNGPVLASDGNYYMVMSNTTVTTYYIIKSAGNNLTSWTRVHTIATSDIPGPGEMQVGNSFIQSSGD